MTYRDERDALENKVSRLEDDLADARRNATTEEASRERAERLEREARELRETAERLEREVAQLRGKRGSKVGTVIAASFGVLGLLAAGSLYFRAAAPHPGPVSQPPVSLPPVAMPVATTPPPVEPTAPRSAKPAEAPPKDVDDARTVNAHWTATVTKSEGGVVPAGATCSIDARIATADTNTGVAELTVTCAGKKLYSSNDALSGMATMDGDARERIGTDDAKPTFSIGYSDVGPRSASRNQVQIDSLKRIGAVWGDNLPRFRVELSMPVDSAPVAGPFEHRLVRKGKVTNASGPAPAKVGAACTARVVPTGQRLGCVAVLACGGKTIVGASDAVTCTYANATPTDFTTAGATRAKLEGDAVHIEGGSGYELDVTLDAP